MKRIDWAIIAALFVLNVALTYPMFLPGDTPYRDSIEGGYQAMARFIDAHPNPWGWNPLQYGGQPTQFVYLPVLPYAVALLPGDPIYVYRLLTATFACLGPATLYAAYLYFSGSRFWAVVAALAYTFASPMYGLISQADKDRGITYLPWRLHVFAKYGESPHNVGLTLIPLAWIAVAKAATSRRALPVVTLSALMAVITLTNWIAALALAITCLAMLACSIGWREFQQWRVLVAAAIAYGLACFWLTPTFIHTIAFNWPQDSFDYKLEAAQHQLMLWYVVLFTGLWLAMRCLRWPVWPKFLALSVFAFGYPVVMHYGLGVDMIPESRRYAVEFELALIAALTAFLQFTTRDANHIRHACAAVAAAAFLAGGFSQWRTYLTQSRTPLMPIPIEQTSEYQVGRWIADQNPQGRVLASGGLRFRLNAWFDLQQLGGAWESGLRNRTPIHVAYRIRAQEALGTAVQDMQSMGVEYVVVHGRGSTEHYRDYKNPNKFDGVLEKVYDHDENAVYRVPYSAPRMQWLDPSRLRFVDATDSAKVVYGEGWHALRNGQEVPIGSDNLGFININGPSAPVDLVYTGTSEQKACAAISLFTAIGVLGWLWKNKA